MNVKSIFITIFLFVTTMTMIVTLGDEFNNKGLMTSEDLTIHNKIKTNINLKYSDNIQTSNSRLEEMRNRLQQRKEVNSFAFQFSQVLIWTYDLLSVVNAVVNITTTLLLLIGIQNVFLLSFFALIDWFINFLLGYVIWRAIFK